MRHAQPTFDIDARRRAIAANQPTSPAATLLLLPRFIDDATVERCLDHSLAHRLTTVAG